MKPCIAIRLIVMSERLRTGDNQPDNFILPVISGGVNHYLDFNRFLFMGVPRTTEIKENGPGLIKRKGDLAQRLFKVFTENADWAQATKYSVFGSIVSHVITCDKLEIDPLSQEAVERTIEYLDQRHRQGTLKDSSCGHKLKHIRVTFQALDLPVYLWFPAQSVFGRTQAETTEAYSDTEMKKLLKILHKMFNQLYTQFIANPLNYINAPKAHKTKKYNMVFEWEHKRIPIMSPLSKLACSAYYLLSYYTWGNSSVLSEIKRPQLDGLDFKEQWASKSAHKRRANKIVTIGIGENDHINIPNYAKSLINKIIKISALIDPSPDALLILNARGGKADPITYNTTSYFNIWLTKKFGLLNDLNAPLVPQAKRFRATGTYRFLIHTGDDLKTAAIAGNTPQVIKRHYSSGNRHENNLQLQASSNTLENIARQRNGIDRAKDKTKEQMRFTILPYEDFIKSKSPPSRNSNGSFCKSPFGDKALEEAKKANQRGLLRKGESLLACANLLRCFRCAHQALVENVAEIWCILSFKECIEESAYLHLDRNHYENNFRQALTDIETRLSLLNRQTVKAAEEKLAQMGRHPLWDAADDIIIRPLP